MEYYATEHSNKIEASYEIPFFKTLILSYFKLEFRKNTIT